MRLNIIYLVTDVSCELDEIVFDGYMSRPCDILSSAANMANFFDQSIIQIEEQTLPLSPVLSISSWFMREG